MRIAWCLTIVGVICSVGLIWFCDSPTWQIRGLAALMIGIWMLDSN